jgi:organic hydroperoxide reductase OsmC/OhrA
MSPGRRVDPDEAFVASLSSCHLLTFQVIAEPKHYVVDGYHDEAVGVLGTDPAWNLAMTRVTLR